MHSFAPGHLEVCRGVKKRSSENRFVSEIQPLPTRCVRRISNPRPLTSNPHFTPSSHLSLPEVADDVIAFAVGLIREDSEQFMCAPAFIKRRNQRLNDRDSAIV